MRPSNQSSTLSPSVRPAWRSGPRRTFGRRVLEKPLVGRRRRVVELVDDDDVECVGSTASRSICASDWIDAKTCRHCSGRWPSTSSSPKDRRGGPAGSRQALLAESPGGARRRAGCGSPTAARRAAAGSRARPRGSCRCRWLPRRGSGSGGAARARRRALENLALERPGLEVEWKIAVASVTDVARTARSNGRASRRGRTARSRVGPVALERGLELLDQVRRRRLRQAHVPLDAVQRALCDRLDDPINAVEKPDSRSKARPSRAAALSSCRTRL